METVPDAAGRYTEYGNDTQRIFRQTDKNDGGNNFGYVAGCQKGLTEKICDGS